MLKYLSEQERKYKDSIYYTEISVLKISIKKQKVNLSDQPAFYRNEYKFY